MQLRIGSLFCLGFALAILGSFVNVAHADPIPFTLAFPTQNTNGTAIPASGTGSLNAWRTEYGSCGAVVNGVQGFGTKAGEVKGTPPTTTGTTPDMAPGTYCLRMFVSNTFGSESDASNAVQRVVVPPKPNPGQIFVGQPTAYEYKPATNTMARIGIVPVGTPCGPETKIVSGVTYCRLEPIEADLINWPTNLKLAEVWAVPSG